MFYLGRIINKLSLYFLVYKYDYKIKVFSYDDKKILFILYTPHFINKTIIYDKLDILAKNIIKLVRHIHPDYFEEIFYINNKSGNISFAKKERVEKFNNSING